MSSLNKEVLVLNKMWQAIRIIRAHRALTLIYADKASAVDTDTWYVYKWGDWIKQPIKETDSVIIGSNYDVKVPSIIVLSVWDKVYRKDVRLTKRNIYIRDGYKCQYTGKKVREADSNIDHVIPRSRGGKNEWGNMVVCSKEINSMKDDRTPKEAGLKLIRKPSKPDSDRLLIDPKMKVPEAWKKFIKGV